MHYDFKSVSVILTRFYCAIVKTTRAANGMGRHVWEGMIGMDCVGGDGDVFLLRLIDGTATWPETLSLGILSKTCKWDRNFWNNNVENHDVSIQQLLINVEFPWKLPLLEMSTNRFNALFFLMYKKWNAYLISEDCNDKFSRLESF